MHPSNQAGTRQNNVHALAIHAPSPIKGIHSIDHYALAVPDLDAAQKFFSAFGLQVERTGQGLLLRVFGNDHVWGKVVLGTTKHLAYLSLNCYEQDLATLAEQCRQAGARPAQPPENARYPEGFWIYDPEGNLLQVRVGPKTTPNQRDPHIATPRATPDRGEITRAELTAVHPRRLSHVLLFAADVETQLTFYVSALGLGLSDKSEGIIAFLHGRHGSDHHLIAFAKAHRRGWHHASWDVPDVEQVGRGWMQMQAAGYDRAWGTGRHVLGSNYFCYIQDPWGSFCEYSADIDFVPEGYDWPSGNYPPEDSLYLWGPPPLPNFIINTEDNEPPQAFMSSAA